MKNRKMSKFVLNIKKLNKVWKKLKNDILSAFDNINNENIEEHCLKFMKISLKDKFIEKMKRIYYIRKFNG